MMNPPDYYVIAKREECEYRYRSESGGFKSRILLAEHHSKENALAILYGLNDVDDHILIKCSTVCTEMVVILEESKKIFPELHV